MTNSEDFNNIKNIEKLAVEPPVEPAVELTVEQAVELNETDINDFNLAGSSIAENKNEVLKALLLRAKPTGIEKKKIADLLYITPKQNHLIAALPSDEFNDLVGDLKLVYLYLGDIIQLPGVKLAKAYFPVNSVISMHYVIESGSSAEVAIVGNEGVLGISLILGGDSMPSSATVVIAGYAYTLEESILKSAFKNKFGFQKLLLKYTQLLYTQTAQTAVCYRHHTVDQQLSRWLLLVSDRINTQNMMVTQELISGLLGVRRESITHAAKRLQDSGLINYRRGHISVVDRELLNMNTCECYKVIKNESLRLMPN